MKKRYWVVGAIAAGVLAGYFSQRAANTPYAPLPPLPVSAADVAAQKADQAKRDAARAELTKFFTDNFSITYRASGDKMAPERVAPPYALLRELAANKGQQRAYGTFYDEMNGIWGGRDGRTGLANVPFSQLIQGLATNTFSRQNNAFIELVAALGGFEALEAQLGQPANAKFKPVLDILKQQPNVLAKIRVMRGDPAIDVNATRTQVQAKAPNLASLMPQAGQQHSQRFATIIDIARSVRGLDETPISSAISIGNILAEPLSTDAEQRGREIHIRAQQVSGLINYMRTKVRGFTNVVPEGSPRWKLLDDVYKEMFQDCMAVSKNDAKACPFKPS